MIDKYILIGQTPVPVDPCDPYTPEGKAGLLEWARWMEEARRQGACTVAHEYALAGLVEVSTVFLGLDHGYSFIRGLEGPLLFETMAFWLPQEFRHGCQQERCGTWAEAEAMHAAMVREVSRPSVIAQSLWDCALYQRRGLSIGMRISWKQARGIPLDPTEQLEKYWREAFSA